jgi:hypothetical protein
VTATPGEKQSEFVQNVFNEPNEEDNRGRSFRSIEFNKNENAHRGCPFLSCPLVQRRTAKNRLVERPEKGQPCLSAGSRDRICGASCGDQGRLSEAKEDGGEGVAAASILVTEGRD